MGLFLAGVVGWGYFWQVRVEAKRDAERLLQPTEAFMARPDDVVMAQTTKATMHGHILCNWDALNRGVSLYVRCSWSD